MYIMAALSPRRVAARVISRMAYITYYETSETTHNVFTEILDRTREVCSTFSKQQKGAKQPLVSTRLSECPQAVVYTSRTTLPVILPASRSS